MNVLRMKRLVLFGTLALLSSACGDATDSMGDDDTNMTGGDCGSGDIDVIATIVHDARDGTIKDSIVVNLNQSADPERPSDCVATIDLVVGADRVTLVETRAGQYEAGYSDVVAGLPPITLIPGGDHELEVDLGSDGSLEATGSVMMSNIEAFVADTSTAGQVTFTWGDAGSPAATTYYVQACDKADFVFPDNFATGWVEGTNAIQFGGGSPWNYFSASGSHYARIQSDTAGTISSDGRFAAWQYPVEPILVY